MRSRPSGDGAALSGAAVTVRDTTEHMGGTMKHNAVRTLAAVAGDVLPGGHTLWPAGWPGEIEAALLDAVFSARATYGTPTSGVRRVVTAWRAHRGTRLDDLTALASFTSAPDRLAAVLGNRQRVPGNYTTKAEAAAAAAAALVTSGIDSSGRIGDGRNAWDALTGVPGLGTTTWETFVLQLGLVGPLALGEICGFVAAALDDGRSDIPETEALGLLGAAAASLDVPQTALLNAVWRSRRTRGPARKPLSA